MLRIEIVNRYANQKGFVVLAERLLVERSFSQPGRKRCPAKKFENLAETPLTFVTLGCIQLKGRRLARIADYLNRL